MPLHWTLNGVLFYWKEENVMTYYDEEQVEKAREMDLLTYLRLYDPGDLVKVSRENYSTRSHDSMSISNGKWMWWSRGFGGASALDYLVKVRGHPFTEAVGMILNAEGSNPPFLVQQKEEKKAKKLLIPEKNSTNDQVIRYLTDRGIDKDLITWCIEKGLIYESVPHRNCIFLGFDESGTARYASFRAMKPARIMGDAAGSDKRYSFRIEGKGSAVHVFESVIDLLSFATLEKMRTERMPEDHMISLAGVYQPSADPSRVKVPAALSMFLDRHKEVNDIAFHLDNDRAGRSMTKALTGVLGSDYRIRDEPPKYGKDMNDELMHTHRMLKDKSERNDNYER